MGNEPVAMESTMEGDGDASMEQSEWGQKAPWTL